MEDSPVDKWVTVVIHHIISDGVSMEILVREFNALISGAALEPPALQYKDYSQWTHSDRFARMMAEQSVYWHAQFKDDIPRINLPYDYPRPRENNFQGRTILFDTSPGTAARLKDFAQPRGMTEYMVFLALFNLLAAKLSNQEDIVIGTPAAGRRSSALENIIGMFINTLALRNRAPGDKSLESYIKDIKKNTLQAFDNQDYPFENLIDHIANSGGNGGAPLLDILFAFQDNLMSAEMSPGTSPGMNGSDIRITPAEVVNETAKFSLTLEIIRLGGHWRVLFEYNTGLFLEETAQTILRYY